MSGHFLKSMGGLSYGESVQAEEQNRSFHQDGDAIHAALTTLWKLVL
jgi:hypothetical protein